MAGITGTFRAVKRAIKAAASAIDPGEYSAGGVQVECPHCRHRDFNLSPNPQAGVNLVCRKCHLSLWFVHKPKAL
jgi:hypothetical protein